MPRLRFGSAIQRHVTCPASSVSAATVREALDAYFDGRPQLRGYLLDERGALRRHVVVFVDGAAVRDRAALSDVVGPESTIDVMQALSGG